MNTDNGTDETLDIQEEMEPTETIEAVESTEESIDDLRARLEEERQARLKAEEIAENQKIRAEKAEKKKSDTPVRQKESSISTKDLYALTDAKVHIDDIDEVERFARFEGVSIAEALKRPAMKAILQEKQEYRTTAQAANTGGARRSSGKVSDDVLVANASAGKLPDSDDEIERLVRAKMLRK